MITTFGSAIFTVFMLTNSLNKVQRNRNGKYDSIQYGHEKHMENLQIPHPILDENGVALGGKKASIQFAYNRVAQWSLDTGAQPILGQYKPSEYFSTKTLLDLKPQNLAIAH